MIDEVLGHYRILGELGTGGMGVVYKARDTRLRREVAIKVIRPDSASDMMQKAFLREARLASSLNHPGIVTIFDILTHEGRECIVMEYVAGKSLSSVIGEKGMAIQAAVETAIQIGDAMAAAHGAGVIHRDLKPGNVLVRPDGQIKILDFGVARLAGHQNDEETTLFDGGLVGTIAYMSPEQSRGGQIDQRSDIYSFAVILNRMLTGVLPHSAPNPAALLHALQTQEPIRPSAIRREVPAALEAIVLRGLRKKPDERFQTMAEMTAALRRTDTRPLAATATDTMRGNETTVTLYADPQSRSFRGIPPVTGSEKASIAVMPFRSVSPDPEDGYLAAGLASEIISALTGVPDLRIVSQLASFRLHDEGTDPAAVARLLNARYVLAGNLRRAGERLRVHVELSDGIEETVIWSRNYDRLAADIFAVQEDISKAIVRSLGGQLIRARTDFAFRTPTGNLDAWGLVRKAYHIWNYEFSVAGVQQAIEFLRRAVELDEEYAIARAYLGVYLMTSAIHCITADPEGARTEALSSANAASQLAPEDPEVLENAALVWLHSGEYQRAVYHLKRAVRMAPYDLVAWGYLGFGHAIAGGRPELDEAVRILKQLITEEADHPSLPYWAQFLTIAYLRLERFEAAVEEGRHAVDLQPGFVYNQVLLAEALCRTGRADAARTVLETIPHYNPLFTLADFQRVARDLSRSDETVEQVCGHVKSLGFLNFN